MNPEKLQVPESRLFGKYRIDTEGYVLLGDIARGELHRQCQYISSFADGLDKDTPHLGDGLRFASMHSKRTGEATGNYHEYRIHADDVAEFVKRVKGHYGDK